ncbi:TrgA family protein [Thalassococcus sp. S3]|uniref:TrgA family protein n=1 Tax=Thalassococcus sp. S3 TaxID=2017482 RepID=UPI0010240CA1|nr:TrgA family protein [Thalassococcus sp. S3]QBF32065.1 tellurium resistance protein [Thalassococcus sp. S3]
MPDAARLFAAISLALLAFIVSVLIIPLMPEGTDPGYFTWINVALGAVVGWVSMGKRAGRHGLTPAINNGLTGMALLVFWGLFVQATNEMVRLAMRNRYDGPFEAIVAIFQIGFDFSKILVDPVVIATLVIGAIFCGLLTEYAWRTWR